MDRNGNHSAAVENIKEWLLKNVTAETVATSADEQYMPTSIEKWTTWAKQSVHVHVESAVC